MRSRAQLINALEIYRENTLKSAQVTPFNERLICAWVFHDHLLEDRTFKPEHIQRALRGEDVSEPSYLRPILEDVRLYAGSIQQVWTWGREGVSSLNLENLQTLHKSLTHTEPREGARIRKNSPVHRDYQQKICPHTQVTSQLKAFFEDVQAFDVHTQDVLSFAARLHHRLMFIYPYRRQPGILARLFTNQFLLAHRYPPLILPCHERGSYYDALASHDSAQLTQLFYRTAWHMLDSLPPASYTHQVRQNSAM